MSETIRINTEEYNEEFSRKLKVGDSVLITGKIYSARDAAHKVMTEALARGEKLPIDWTEVDAAGLTWPNTRKTW